MLDVFDKRDPRPPDIVAGTNVTIANTGLQKTVSSSGGGGGSTTFVSTTLTVSYQAAQADGTIIDAALTGTEKILVFWAPTTDLDMNSPEMDDVTFQVVSVAAGSFIVRVCNPNGFVGGAYKVMYLVGA